MEKLTLKQIKNLLKDVKDAKPVDFNKKMKKQDVINLILTHYTFENNKLVLIPEEIKEIEIYDKIEEILKDEIPEPKPFKPLNKRIQIKRKTLNQPFSILSNKITYNKFK